MNSFHRAQGILIIITLIIAVVLYFFLGSVLVEPATNWFLQVVRDTLDRTVPRPLPQFFLFIIIWALTYWLIVTILSPNLDAVDYIERLTNKQSRDTHKTIGETKLQITAFERTKDRSPHIEVGVVNKEQQTVFCKVKNHAIYNSSDVNIKRDISDYANHFSWSGGSDKGTKEIPSGLDGIINLVRTNYAGYRIAFLFDENPHSYWSDEGVYKIDMEIVGTVAEDTNKKEFSGKRVIVEFNYKKNEVRNSNGEVINNGELKLLSFNVEED